MLTTALENPPRTIVSFGEVIAIQKVRFASMNVNAYGLHSLRYKLRSCGELRFIKERLGLLA